MIILRQNNYSFFNSYDIYDFLDDVKNCKYSNKDKELEKNCLEFDSTFYYFDKKNVNKKEISKKLNSLDSLVSDVLKRNKIQGTTKDWKLYAVSIISPGKIEIGLENKNGQCFSCEL